MSCAGNYNQSLDVVDLLDINAKDSKKLVFSDSAYSSAAGVCFSRASIELIVQKVATRAVLEWIDRDHHSQQDKEIQRLMTAVGGRSVWPVVPRSHHEGWYGAGCTIATPPKGSLSERIEYIREVLNGKRQIKCEPKWGHDITVIGEL